MPLPAIVAIYALKTAATYGIYRYITRGRFAKNDNNDKKKDS